MAVLYRGSVNNGVRTILTPAAVSALEAISAFEAEHGTQEGTEALAEIVRRGTLTFVHDNVYGIADGHRYYTGTFADFEKWCKGHTLLDYRQGNFVPFSNGRNAEEHPDYVRTPRQVVEMFELGRV